MTHAFRAGQDPGSTELFRNGKRAKLELLAPNPEPVPALPNGPWDNIIRWPCEDCRYATTLRAEIYSYRLLQHTWRDGSLASKAFGPWREKWVAAERASRAFGACAPGEVAEAFRTLPLAPLTFYSRLNLHQGLVGIPDLRTNRLDQSTLSRYANACLAHIAREWAAIGGNTVALKFNERTIAFYSQPAPTLHYFCSARSVVVPGNASLELHHGYEFWIPPGAGIPAWPDEKWRGEVAATDPSLGLGTAFLRGFLEGYIVANGGNIDPKQARVNYRLSAARWREHGYVPQGGDSLDLMAILNARPFKELTLDDPRWNDGRQLFQDLNGQLTATGRGLETLMTQAIAIAKNSMEESLR